MAEIPSHATFQSTRPLRSATSDCRDIFNWWDVSIHAPFAKRDHHRRHQSMPFQSFNPRTPKSATRSSSKATSSRPFQSTHSEECDLNSFSVILFQFSFNPRTPKSATFISQAGLYRDVVSIHALRRVRQRLHLTQLMSWAFQSTHSEECDRCRHASRQRGRCFNPRTPKSATCTRDESGGRPVVSIHALRRVRPTCYIFSFDVK